MNNMPIDKLHELYVIDQCQSNVLRHKITRGRARAGNGAGTLTHDGRWQLALDGKKYAANRVVFAMVHGRWPELDVDHIDGNPGNNHPANLRECTRKQNLANVHKPIRNKHGYKGVWYDKPNPKRNKPNGAYVAALGHGADRIYLGRFKTAKEAGEAYRQAAIALHGQFYSDSP